MDTALHDTLTGWRRYLHANPELATQEHATAAFVCARLSELGVPFTAGVGGTGVVATLARGSSNRSVALRADMDALPITEATDLPHASTKPGLMHACGHDGHTTALLGAAALLARDTEWSGTVQLIFQPAEEGARGAMMMLADGLFDRFPAERVFGFHNWPGLAAGTVAVHPGPVMAAGGRVTITIDGHAGHAAMPHLARDPMVAAGHLLVALQSIVARSVDPLDSAVVSICMIDGGVAANQIPQTVTMRGTARSHRAEVRDLIEAQVRRIAEGIAHSFDMRITADITRGAPVTRNSLPEADLAAATAEALGLPVRRDLPPSMAGEDFGWFLERKPGAFVWIGNGPAEPGRELHNPGYDFNDAILPTASGWMAGVAKRSLAT